MHGRLSIMKNIVRITTKLIIVVIVDVTIDDVVGTIIINDKNY